MVSRSGDKLVKDCQRNEENRTHTAFDERRSDFVDSLSKTNAEGGYNTPVERTIISHAITDEDKTRRMFSKNVIVSYTEGVEVS